MYANSILVDLFTGSLNYIESVNNVDKYEKNAI